MQFNLKFMREFFKFFLRSETGAREEDISSGLSTKEVGEINVITPKGVEKFPLAITNQDRNQHNSAWMVKTVDGKFIVVFHFDYFIKQIYSPNMNGLYAVVAHEIGHYLCGHFEGSSGAVDIKPEVQEFFFKRYQENQTPANEEAYMRTVFFGLLKGGVIIREFEADLMALRFIPIADLVHIHTQDFANTQNVFTIVEKVNRIRRLNRYCEDVEFDREGYSLFIQLFDTTEPTERVED